MTGPTSIQDQRSDAARRRLIQATIEILATEGYRRTTFTRIQEVSGTSRGLVSYHFGSKLALIEHVAEAIRADFTAAVELADRGVNGFEALSALVRIYFDRLERDSRPAKVMLILGAESIGEHPPIRDAMRDGYAYFTNQLRGCLDAGIDDGSIRPETDGVGFTLVIHAMIRGSVLLYLVDPDGFDLSAARHAALKSLDVLRLVPESFRAAG